MTQKRVYIFFRGDSFYPLELGDDADARRNAECNPGTTKVEDALTRVVVWPRRHTDEELDKLADLIRRN